MNEPLLPVEFRHKSWEVFGSMCSVIWFVHTTVNKSFIHLATFNYKTVRMLYPPGEQSPVNS